MKDENPKLIHKKRRVIIRPAAVVAQFRVGCFLAEYLYSGQSLRKGLKETQTCVDMQVLRGSIGVYDAL